MKMVATELSRIKQSGTPHGVVGVHSSLELRKKQFWQSQDMGRKIRNAARGQRCTLRLEYCNNDPTTTVFAHAPSIDNGMGLKQARDFWGAFACSNCHAVVDGAIPNDRVRIIIMERWLAAIYETQKHLIEIGLIQYDDR
jgi:hypothetical protein